MTTVLLAEDDAAIAEPLSRALQREGYEVSVAADGLIALEHVRGGGVDLLVLDLGLPGMDGLEVCRRIRLEVPDLPVLMLTARSASSAAVSASVTGLRSGLVDTRRSAARKRGSVTASAASASRRASARSECTPPHCRTVHTRSTADPA